MKKFLILALLFSNSVFAKTMTDEEFMKAIQGSSPYNTFDGISLLELGRNAEAVKFFKDQAAYSKEHKIEMGPYMSMYVAIGDYRLKNYVESKQYLTTLLNMNQDDYCSGDYMILGYCALVATKTNDSDFFKKAYSHFHPSNQWYKQDADFLVRDFYYATRHLNLDYGIRTKITDQMNQVTNMYKNIKE